MADILVLWHDQLTLRARFAHSMCVVLIVFTRLASLADSIFLPSASLTRWVMTQLPLRLIGFFAFYDSS